MKKNWRKRAVVGAVLLFVCAAVYMNWRYAGSLEDTSKVLGESTLVSGEKAGETATAALPEEKENDYFATARLSRKQARDNAINMLKDASTDENADQSVPVSYTHLDVYKRQASDTLSGGAVRHHTQGPA